jgi:hypothetical protein
MSHPSLAARVRQFLGAVRSAFITVVNTNQPTLDTLRKIAGILHEAEWDEPRPVHALTAEELERLRTEAGRFLRPDDLKVIQAVVADRRSLVEVAAEFNRSPDDLNKQLAQALADLAAFAREAKLAPA